MKKFLKVTYLVFSISLILSASVFAQQGTLDLGGNLIYGSGVGGGSSDLNNDIGLTVNGYYGITDDIEVGASFGYFFPKKEGNVKLNVTEFNIDGHYFFVKNEMYGIYGLAGLNFVTLHVDYSDEEFGGSYSTSETGLNIGIGAEYGLNFGNLFGELKYAGLGGDADELVLGAGVRIPVM